MMNTSIISPKADRIIYWISTIWLSLGMLSSGIVQVLRIDEEVAFIMKLGYPTYFLIIIGTWKLLGVLAILLPGFQLVKEWAYAGFFFTSTGAICSHIAVEGVVWIELLPLLLFLLLIVTSWFFRPATRKLVW